MSKDKDSTTLQEYFISGIVILFFGLLYLFLSDSFKFGFSKDNLLPTLATTSPTSLAERQINNSSDEIDQQDDKNQAENNASNSDLAKNSSSNTPTSAPPSALPQNNSTKPQQQPAVVDTVNTLSGKKTDVQSHGINSQLVANTIPQTTQEPQQVEPEVAVNSDVKIKAANTPETKDIEVASRVQEQQKTSDKLVYKLPDGTEVKIASKGFGNKFKQALENGTAGKPIIFDRVYFASSSDKLDKRSNHQISEAAALLNTYQEIKIAIRGHSDNTGSSKKNSILSLLRSGSMKKALIGLGIDAKRIQIEGVGEQEPIASNKTRRGRRNNRRIDLIIKK